MPNAFTGNIDKWLLLSETQTDFAALFVRAWIPFNAWYCTSYGSKKDRTCLNQIKSDSNPFRAKIIALLLGSDYESKLFQNLLKRMYDLLEQNPIPDASESNRLSFKSICFRDNPLTSTPAKNKRNHEFKAEYLSSGSVKAMIIKNNESPVITKYTYNHNKYDYSHFVQDIESESLSREQKDFLKECVREINPKKKESILSKSKSNALEIDGLYFINDPNLISIAIIEIFYKLRCFLFHGEIPPSRNNLLIYEPAYNMFRILLESLR